MSLIRVPSMGAAVVSVSVLAHPQQQIVVPPAKCQLQVIDKKTADVVVGVSPQQSCQ